MANIITISRIIFSIALLFFPVFSPVFFVLYIVAGLTDMIDGTVARRTGKDSEFGSKLDTVADFVLVVVCLIKLIPVLNIPIWLMIWIVVIAMIKVFNIIFGYVIRKEIVSLHTVMNKVTGGLLFVFPLTLTFVDVKYSGAVVCAVATFSAVQEWYYSTLNEMISKAFPGKTAMDIQELTEGMCNVTYDITFSDGDECILKIAAKDRTGNTSNEIRLMDAEVTAMKLVRENCSFKVADVLAYDCSGTICDGDYFFMEKLPGSNYSFIKDNLPEETNRKIAREIGCISRQLCSITNPQFGFLGDTVRYDSLSGFVRKMLANLISDAQKKKVDLCCDTDKLLKCFEEEKHIFDEVSFATLVHWDMWEGNVFVDGDHVSGIIDWERAMWGEAFMDDRFRKQRDFAGTTSYCI